jgi:hypothetical protein
MYSLGYNTESLFQKGKIKELDKLEYLVIK